VFEWVSWAAVEVQRRASPWLPFVHHTVRVRRVLTVAAVAVKVPRRRPLLTYLLTYRSCRSRRGAAARALTYLPTYVSTYLP
jgi:hypothetical protein